MDILLQCPAHVVTGGTESIHNFAAHLNMVRGVNARIMYTGDDLNDPCPDEFAVFGVPYVTELPDGYSGVVIFPEIYANHVTHAKYNKCVKSIMWLGVGAFYWHNHGRFDFLKVPNVLHLVKSAYAVDFLRKLGITETVNVSGGINDAFYDLYDEKPRSNTILYNPAKADAYTYDLIGACPEYEFKPITGYTRDEVIALMRSSKLYIDFGAHPGRERMPREAVMCGCCILTSKSGSAFYNEDVPIPTRYKFEKLPHSIFAIKRAMRDILNDYDAHVPDFNRIRAMIWDDRDGFDDRCEAVAKRFDEIFNNHTRV